MRSVSDIPAVLVVVGVCNEEVSCNVSNKDYELKLPSKYLNIHQFCMITLLKNSSEHNFL